MDDVLGLNIDDPSERVSVLELHDEAQYRVEPSVPFDPGDGLGDPLVIALLFVAAEGLEEVFFGWEPAIEGWPGDPGDRGDVREG